MMEIIYIPPSVGPGLSSSDLLYVSHFSGQTITDISSIPEDLLSYFAPGTDLSSVSRFSEHGLPICIIDGVFKELESADPRSELLSLLGGFSRPCYRSLEPSFCCPVETSAAPDSSSEDYDCCPVETCAAPDSSSGDSPLLDLFERPIGKLRSMVSGSRSRLSSLAESDEEKIERMITELQEVNMDRLRELGISEQTLRFLVGFGSQPSRMTITRRAGIFLPDYDNREIHMDDKTKALYFLFLKNPSGISIKQLSDHSDELLSIYQKISGRDDLRAMRDTISRLVDPFRNDVNISLSRIKKAFCSSMSDSIAKSYYVSGQRGGLRTITIDRSLVSFEL